MLPPAALSDLTPVPHFPLVRRTPTAVAWLDFLRAVGHAPLTLDAYGRALDGFLAFCDRHGHDPEQADLPVVAAYLQVLRDRGLAAATLRQALCVVRLWSKHLVGLGVRDSNPVPEGGSRGGVYGILGAAPRLGAGRARAGLLPRTVRYPWIPTDDEWLRFLRAASMRSTRDRLMLALAYAGALRRQEVVGLAVADVDAAHRLVTVRPEVAKRGRGRVVAYPRETTPLLVAYLERRRALSAESGPLFLSESNRNRGHALSTWTWHDVVGRIAADADLPQFTTHTLRHLRLTHLAVKGLGLHEIATYAGHRSLESTMAYVHLSGRHIDERVTATLLEVEAAACEILVAGSSAP
jgi:site-specific recombinase XerD